MTLFILALSEYGRPMQIEPSYAGKTLREWRSDLSNEDPSVLNKVFESLVNIGKPAVPILIDALVEGDSEVRISVCHALGELGSSAVEAIPALRQALNDQYYDVSDAAAAALESIRLQSEGPPSDSPAKRAGAKCFRIIEAEVPFLLEHYRFPREKELERDWKNYARSGTDPICTRGDFNDDGMMDYATILLHQNKETEGFGLFAIVSQGSELEYAVFPLHAKTVDVAGWRLAQSAPKGSSLEDDREVVFARGEGWIETRPPGKYPEYRTCRVRGNPSTLSLGSVSSIDYVITEDRRRQGEPERLLFFWNHSSSGFWRWSLCPTSS